METTSHCPLLIITVPAGTSNTENVQAWTNFAKESGGVVVLFYGFNPKDVSSLNKMMQRTKIQRAWIADSNYSPYAIRFDSLWNIPRGQKPLVLFRVGLPNFVNDLSTPKKSGTDDFHDAFGGLRYVDLTLSDGELTWDTETTIRHAQYENEIVARLHFPYSVYQLSSYEPRPMVDYTFDILRFMYPTAKQFRSLYDIYTAHADLTDLAHSSIFIVVDADFVITHPIVTEVFSDWDRQATHVWYALNPVNGLIYGHGGPKAFGSSAFTETAGKTIVDVATASSPHFKVHPRCVGVHQFNWSAESSWRTAFREAAKLTWSQRTDSDASSRLDQWQTIQDSTTPFCGECRAGARDGREWASNIISSGDRVKVNDWAWLHMQWRQLTGQGPLAQQIINSQEKPQ